VRNLIKVCNLSDRNFFFRTLTLLRNIEQYAQGKISMVRQLHSRLLSVSSFNNILYRCEAESG
jgi:hypothetical protein